jgi:ketosteroid isomerase-like protein
MKYEVVVLLPLKADNPRADSKSRSKEIDAEWNEAYPRLDCAALDRIIADDWVCIDGTGLMITKSELLTRVASSVGFLDPYKCDEIALRTFGEAVIVTGRLSGQMRDSDGIHDVNQRYMRVYVKRNERWQAVATQVTKVKETVLSCRITSHLSTASCLGTGRT